MSKVIVVGLDGATWDLLKTWVDQGELPALRNLMENGVWGTLESTIPPLTGPAWASFSTGSNPGRHGIFGFARLENNCVRLYKSNDIRSKTIADVLSKRSLRSIVIGLPLSFPPSSDFKGIMVSDFLYHKEEVLPRSKRDYIKGYRLVPDLSLRGDELLEDMVQTANSQVEVAKRLFVGEDWDLYFFYFGPTDTVLHFFWKDVSNNTAMGQKAKKIFHIADGFLKWVSNQMDAETILLVMSDHGFAACPYEINLNSLFMKRGLLRTRTKEAAEPEDETLGKHIEHLGAKMREKRQRSMRVRRSVFELATYPGLKRILGRVYKAVFRGAKATSSVTIDYGNSAAFVLPGCVSTHIRETDGKKREKTVQEVVRILERLKYKGERVFDQVLLKEEVYSGSFTESSPDILLIPNGFFISSALDAELYGEFAPGGFHDLRGVFVAYGSNVKTSPDGLNNLRIYDIVPTVLHILGLPIPEDMDGRVLKEIYEEGSDLARREITYQEAGAADEKERLREKIKGKIRELKPFRRI